MFSKKPHGDIKKSTQKVLDPKKDTITRLKHLRIIFESQTLQDAKEFFHTHYSHIYYIFNDVFTIVEGNLKQRAHKAHREELDTVLFIFEKILILSPQLIHVRWQFHSIGRVMKKLLHPGNSIRLRREAMRLFVIWFQILMENAGEELVLMFASLVPAFPHPFTGSWNHSLEHIINDSVKSPGHSISTESNFPLTPVEITPLLPPQAGERGPDDLPRFILENLLDFMVSQFILIQWPDNTYEKRHRCFEFLFENFKRYYLPHIFPDFNRETSLYLPKLDLPTFRTLADLSKSIDPRHRKNLLAPCRVAVVRWFAGFAHPPKRPEDDSFLSDITLPPTHDTSDSGMSQLSSVGPTNETEPSNLNSTFNMAQLSSISSPANMNSMLAEQVISPTNPNIEYANRYNQYCIVVDTLYSTRKNVDLVQEVFRQAFLFPMSQCSTIRKVILVYREWIQGSQANSMDCPIFIQEPEAEVEKSSTPVQQQEVLEPMSSTPNKKHMLPQQTPLGRLRADSYLVALDPKKEDVRAGSQTVIQVFLTNAANVFLLESSTEPAIRLDDQVDLCKRILNVYRSMVMQCDMTKDTWEQLLNVLLKITTTVLRDMPMPLLKDMTLGGRLAHPIFETLIVTWIKANLNVQISTEFWDYLLTTLSPLTHWDDLIKVWSKTMHTLTRVLTRHVYNLELNDLPLDRLTEQKAKKRRGLTESGSKSKGESSKSWVRMDSAPAQHYMPPAAAEGHSQDAQRTHSSTTTDSISSVEPTTGISNAELGGRITKSHSDTNIVGKAGTDDGIGHRPMYCY